MYYKLVSLTYVNDFVFGQLLRPLLLPNESSQMLMYTLFYMEQVFNIYNSVENSEFNSAHSFNRTDDSDFLDEPIDQKNYPGNRCPLVVCGPGKYKVYGEIAGGYGWRCDLCPVNHYKSTVGDDGCIPCRGQFSIDNGFRTKCIDPYRDVYPNIIKMVLFQSTIALSAFGFVGSFFTLGVFIKKRKSPVVTSSDFTASTIHLIIINLAFIASIFPQTINLSEIMCVVRISSVTIVNALNISFMLVKSQKLLQAFLSKVPITLEEARKTVTLQIVTVLVTALITGALIVVAYNVKCPVLSFDLNMAKMERIHFCDTSFHSNVVLGFIMMIQFVQAFRGRHLPSVMNDGMSLVYASFTSIIMLIVMFAIGNFQKSIEKELYQNLTIVINTLVIWLMMYGQKAIRMLMYPKQNTKRYFQDQRMLEMRERVNERMAVRSTNTTG